jgi:hypothetical protein
MDLPPELTVSLTSAEILALWNLLNTTPVLPSSLANVSSKLLAAHTQSSTFQIWGNSETPSQRNCLPSSDIHTLDHEAPDLPEQLQRPYNLRFRTSRRLADSEPEDSMVGQEDGLMGENPRGLGAASAELQAPALRALCPRGGKKARARAKLRRGAEIGAEGEFEVTAPNAIPEDQNLGDTGQLILASAGSYLGAVVAGDDSQELISVERILKFITQFGSIIDPVTSDLTLPMDPDLLSLVQVLQRCIRLEGKEEILHFRYMIETIQLAYLFER